MSSNDEPRRREAERGDQTARATVCRGGALRAANSQLEQHATANERKHSHDKQQHPNHRLVLGSLAAAHKAKLCRRLHSIGEFLAGGSGSCTANANARAHLSQVTNENQQQFNLGQSTNSKSHSSPLRNHCKMPLTLSTSNFAKHQMTQTNESCCSYYDYHHHYCCCCCSCYCSPSTSLSSSFNNCTSSLSPSNTNSVINNAIKHSNYKKHSNIATQKCGKFYYRSATRDKRSTSHSHNQSKLFSIAIAFVLSLTTSLISFASLGQCAPIASSVLVTSQNRLANSQQQQQQQQQQPPQLLLHHQSFERANEALAKILAPIIVESSAHNDMGLVSNEDELVANSIKEAKLVAENGEKRVDGVVSAPTENDDEIVLLVLADDANSNAPAGTSFSRLRKRSGISDQRLAEIQMIRALKKQIQRATMLAVQSNPNDGNGGNSSEQQSTN